VAFYLTDSWSSIYGLASVSYGDPSRYPEVANQVIQKFPLADIVNRMTAESVLEDKITIDKVKAALEKEYIVNSTFAKYLDTSRKSLNELARIFRDAILSSYDEMPDYENSLSSVVEYANLPGISPESFSRFLSESITDFNTYSELAISIPGRKLDKLPAGEKIGIDETVDLGSDHNGVSLVTGYLTPENYFTGTALPGVGSTGDNLPNSIIDSISQGFFGYGTLEILENIFRPGLASVVSPAEIGELKNVARSVSGLGTIGSVRDLTSIGALSPGDQAMYDVDISELVVEANGYTVYDPARDSNGDFFDTSIVPDFEGQNSDPSKGLPYSQRTRSEAF
jgi:hypothetical protein